ncbi:MAG TPA: hypothetical protein VF147_12890 [Vicinamibacterales bacterium]
MAQSSFPHDCPAPTSSTSTRRRALRWGHAAAQAVGISLQRACAVAVLAIASSLALHAPPLHAASGYDLTDLWVAPAKPGWGIQLVQQRDVIFATLFVYDAASQPAWYSATLEFQGLTPQTHALNYAGALYRTTGPWFGVGTAFDPGRVAYTRVGTMKVTAPTMFSATLEYDVDGVAVATPIERLAFRLDDYNGTYTGAQTLSAARCSNPADNGTATQNVALQVTQAGNTMSMVLTSAARTCTFTGTYSQDGRLGRFASTYVCSTGDRGAMTFEEMNIQRFGVMGRMFGADARGCQLTGTFAGVGP